MTSYKLQAASFKLRAASHEPASTRIERHLQPKGLQRAACSLQLTAHSLQPSYLLLLAIYFLITSFLPAAVSSVSSRTVFPVNSRYASSRFCVFVCAFNSSVFPIAT